jgi:Fe-S cluster biogenesis protein NfuA/nitrite reductase/ring-hydroxylating ferredoxin subunit
MFPNAGTPTVTAPGRAVTSNKNNGGRQQEDELGGKRIHELVEQAEALPDPAARALLHECLQSVLALHGQGLARILQLAQDGGPDGQAVFDRLIHDNVVRGLLLIHGLHPVDLGTRLREALKKVRPYMESHGGNVELISLTNDVARLRFQGACKTCPSSAVTMELAIRQAIEEACPDLQGLELEGVTEKSASKPADESTALARQHAPAWSEIDGLGTLGSGEIRIVEEAGIPLVLCNMKETLYAYRNVCPACGLAFESGALEDGWLKCRLGHRFNVQQAGVCPDDPSLHLDPFPLLVENGVVKVAVR